MGKSKRAQAASKIQRAIRSRSARKSAKAIETSILAKDNKQSVAKVEAQIDDIKDMLKSGQGNQKKSQFLRNVILISLLGLGGITAYGALDDIKKKVSAINKARKSGNLGAYLKNQASRKRVYEDGTKARYDKGVANAKNRDETFYERGSRGAGYLKDSFYGGGSSIYGRVRGSPSRA